MEDEKWGKGWDYIVKDIWHNLDLIREDNLNRSYNNQNIDFCFSYIYSTLLRAVIPKINEQNWEKKDKIDLLNKLESLIGLFKEARTYPDKVIAVNMSEQFLRGIY